MRSAEDQTHPIERSASAPPLCSAPSARARCASAIDRTLPLAQAAEAHRLLESRQTSGKLLLIP